MSIICISLRRLLGVKMGSDIQRPFKESFHLSLDVQLGKTNSCWGEQLQMLLISELYLVSH